MASILEAIDTSSAKGMRDRALFELLYSSGLRAGEASGLRLQDIDREGRLVRVRGKFGRERLVPISEVAAAFLEKLVGQRRAGSREGPVFVGRGGALQSSSISRIFRKILRAQGIREPASFGALDPARHRDAPGSPRPRRHARPPPVSLAPARPPALHCCPWRERPSPC